MNERYVKQDNVNKFGLHTDSRANLIFFLCTMWEKRGNENIAYRGE